MNAYQPKTAPSYGYDSPCGSFQGTGSPIFSYDSSANYIGLASLENSPGHAQAFLQFTGKERDAESGLDYFGARYYGSALGRWTSPDKPLQDQEPENPQSWNLYAYGRNNPLNGTDPTGENWFTDALQAVGNCFRYGDCHTTAVVAEHREDAFMARLVSNGKPLTPGQKEDLQQQMFGGLTPSQVIKAVDDYNSLIPHVKQDDDSGMPPMPSGFGPKPKLTSNPKHNPNSASPEPNNVKDLFDQSIEDSRGVRCVPVQREMERGAPAVSEYSPWGVDFQGMRVYRSDVTFGEERKSELPRSTIVSMSPPSYPSAWLRPRRARLRFTWQSQCIAPG